MGSGETGGLVGWAPPTIEKTLNRDNLNLKRTVQIGRIGTALWVEPLGLDVVLLTLLNPACATLVSAGEETSPLRFVDLGTGVFQFGWVLGRCFSQGLGYQCLRLLI